MLSCFAPITAEAAHLSSVGISIAADKIIQMHCNNYLQNHTIRIPSQTLANKKRRNVALLCASNSDDRQSVFLYSEKNAFLSERIELACELWSEGFRVEYTHSATLGPLQIKSYANLLQIRFVVVFKKIDFTTTDEMVSVYDLFNSTSKVTSDKMVKLSKQNFQTKKLSKTYLCDYLKSQLTYADQLHSHSHVASNDHSLTSSVSASQYQHQHHHSNVVANNSGSSHATLQLIFDQPASYSKTVLKQWQKEQSSHRKYIEQLIPPTNTQQHVIVCDLPLQVLHQFTEAFYYDKVQSLQSLHPKHKSWFDFIQKTIVTFEENSTKDKIISNNIFIYSTLDKRITFLNI